METPSSSSSNNKAKKSSSTQRPIKCRYGSECRNINRGCKFLHPCRYGMKCFDPSCTFFHHPNVDGVCAVINNNNNNNSNNSNSNSAKSSSGKANGVGGNLKKKKKKCRWGDACRNKKCGFVHPTKMNQATSAAVIVDDEAEEKSSMDNDDYEVTKKSNTVNNDDDDPPLDNSNVAPFNDNNDDEQQLMYSTSPTKLTNDGTTNINVNEDDDNSYSPQLLFAKGITNDNIVTTTTTSSHNSLFVNNTGGVNVGVNNDGNNNIHSNYNSHQLTEECDWMYEVLGLNHHRNNHQVQSVNTTAVPSVNNTVGQTNFHGIKSVNNYDNNNNAIPHNNLRGVKTEGGNNSGLGLTTTTAVSMGNYDDNVIPQTDYQQRINNDGGYTTAATPKGNETRGTNHLGIMDNGYYHHHHSNATPMNHYVNTNAATRNDYGTEESTVMMGIIDGHHHPINNVNINTFKNHHHGQSSFNVGGYMHQSNITSPKNHEMQQQHGTGYNTTTTCTPRSYNTNDGMQHDVVARVTTTTRMMTNNHQYHPSGEVNNAMARGDNTNATSILYNNVDNRVVPPRSNVIPTSGYNDNNVGATVESSSSSSTPSSSRVFSNTKVTDNHYVTHDNRNISTVTDKSNKNSNTPSTKAISSKPYTNHNRKVYLLSTTEIENYRNTAIELQFLLSTTSSPTNNNNTTAKLLLQQCRTNQRHIQSLLQNHMNSNSVVDEVDEGNLMDILELNELLLNAIDEAVASASVSGSADTNNKSRESDEQSSSPLNGVGDKDVNKKKKLLNCDNGKKQNTIPLKGEQQQLHSGVEGGVKQVKIKKGKKENHNSSTGATASTTVQSKNSAGADAKAQSTNGKNNHGSTRNKPPDVKGNNASSTTQSSNGKNNAADNKVQSSNGKSNASTSNSSANDKPEPTTNDNTSPPNDQPEIIPEIDALEAAKLEKQRIARLMQKAREEAALAKEKKKSKKSKKHEKWLQDQETAKEQRASYWKEKIGKEMDYLGLIRKLLIAEFLRQNKKKAIVTSEAITSDAEFSDVIEVECREAYHTIFRELKVRIVVAGSQHKELNGRNGTIRYWDKEKGKFFVGLDTKKSMDSNEMYLSPDVLDALAVSSSQSKKSEKRNHMTSSYDVNVPILMKYGDIILGLQFTLKKSHINALGSAESTKIGLEAFCRQRDEEERQKKLEEERERAREEEDRKRRAARKAAENMAWERRKEQMRKDKEEYERMKREWKRWQDNDDDGNDEAECNCPRCRFGDKFYARGSSGAFFFNIGGIPFRVNFGSDSEEEDFFDEFDEEWEEQVLEEKREENRKQAKILGVEPDADERTLKIAYRKLALQFHPDKWKSTSDHGMSRKDAENKFKAIQSAYDHLMSNFD